jgi:hypothetical protein
MRYSFLHSSADKASALTGKFALERNILRRVLASPGPQGVAAEAVALCIGEGTDTASRGGTVTWLDGTQPRK